MDSLNVIHSLVGQSLCYGIKSPDTDLYDFGFGNMENVSNLCGEAKEYSEFALHVMCRFKVIWKSGEKRVDRYYEDTPCEKFHFDVKRLIGLKVTQVALSDKNDLWIDFGDSWMVFATFENGEESWRFFAPNTDTPHLVASNSWIRFS